MIENLILELLLQRNKISLRGIGVLYLERQWASFSDYGNQITPPFDNLLISDIENDYDIDIVEIISNELGCDVNTGYGLWCDYLATEAVDGVLTINTVAMIDINQLAIIALDPTFAEILVPDNEIVEVTQIEMSTPQNVTPRTKNNSLPHNLNNQRSNFGAFQYLALISAIASALYLIYFFATK